MVKKRMTEMFLERMAVQILGRVEWMEQARCREIGGDLWHLEDTEGRKAVDKKLKLICSECPVQQACLNHAITFNEKHGIWGGLTPTRRARLRKKLQDAT